MRSRFVCVSLVTVAVSVALSLHAQVEPVQRSFYAEQRREIWYEDGEREEDVSQITRLANRSFLALHPLRSVKDRRRHIDGYYFYLVDTEARISYSGETDLRAAWLQYLDGSELGQDQMVGQYGDCSVLADDSVKKVSAGNILGFAVLRIERVEGRELYTSWIAPELGCFPLRSQVLVDSLVRKRVDTVRLELLPAETRISIPKGVQVVSPQAYCDLYRKHHGEEYLPQRVCAKYEKRYREFNATNGLRGAKPTPGDPNQE